MNPQTWFYRGQERAAEALRGLRDRSACDRAAVAAAAAEDVGDASPARADRACAAGCAHCCHVPVGVAPSEVERLGQALGDRATPAWRAQLRRRGAEAERDGWRRLAAARQRCVLLDAADRCSVYEARPIACRGWHTSDRAACAADHRGEPAWPEPDGAAFCAALGAHAALVSTDGGESYELSSALARWFDGRSMDGALAAGHSSRTV